MVAARSRDPHKRFGHKAGKDAIFTGHLSTDLPVCCQPVRIAQNVIKHPVQFQLARRILVIALDHIKTHFTGIADHLHRDWAQAFKLVNMIAIRLGITVFWLAVFVKLQPHHFRLGSDPQAPAMLGFELFVHAAQISTTI